MSCLSTEVEHVGTILRKGWRQDIGVYLHGESPEGEGLEVDGNTAERYRSSKSTIELFIVKKPESFIKKKQIWEGKILCYDWKGGKSIYIKEQLEQSILNCS